MTGTEAALKELQDFIKGGAHLSRVSASLVLKELTQKDRLLATLSDEITMRGIEITELRKASAQEKTESFTKLEKRRKGVTERLRRLISRNAD